ncbi:MAG: SH3 domain-containing protein [Pseudomonadota bacterium]
MRGLIKSFGYLFLGVLILGAIFGESPDRTSNAATDQVAPAARTQVQSQQTGATDTRPQTANPTINLPNDPDKVAIFTETPRKAAARRPAPQSQKSVYVTGSRVNVRAGPSTQFDRLGSFAKGTKLRAISQSNGWTEISGAAGSQKLTGWMASQYLAAQPPKQTAQPAAVTPQRRIASPSTADISRARDMIIRQSIAAYPGNCPCDYNRDRAGRRCGKRSAWSRPGGASPICYPSDVTHSHLVAYFKRQGLNYP